MRYTERAPDSFAQPHENIRAVGVRAGSTIVDFGTGSGAYALSAAELTGDAGRVYAIDIQKELLTKLQNAARERDLHNIDVVWGDVDEPSGSKLADGVADMVIMSNILFQLQDKETAVREARRVLRAGGTLVVIDWSESFGGVGPHKNDVVTKERAQELATKSGFTLERTFEAGAHHYGVVFRRES